LEENYQPPKSQLEPYTEQLKKLFKKQVPHTVNQVMCQHFSGHIVKQILAAFRSPLVTNSYSSNEAVHGCKTPQCIQIVPALSLSPGLIVLMMTQFCF
jgi:hypothetical protein